MGLALCPCGEASQELRACYPLLENRRYEKYRDTWRLAGHVRRAFTAQVYGADRVSKHHFGRCVWTRNHLLTLSRDVFWSDEVREMWPEAVAVRIETPVVRSRRKALDFGTVLVRDIRHGQRPIPARGGALERSLCSRSRLMSAVAYPPTVIGRGQVDHHSSLST